MNIFSNRKFTLTVHMNKLVTTALIAATIISTATHAYSAPAACSANNMNISDARTDKSQVRRGESITFSIDACYEPPQYTVWAKFREAPDVVVPLTFDDGPRLWSFVVNVTQEIQPGTYNVDFLAKNAAGNIVHEYPKESGVTAEVVLDEHLSKELENWRTQKQSLIDAYTKRLDQSYSSVPKFPIVGVWFDSPAYHRHHITNSESKGPWNPFLRKSFSDEINYLSKTLGINLIMLSGGTEEENQLARSLFPHFITSDPQPGDYAIFDEPDYTSTPPEDVIKWANTMKEQGVKTIINFSGHKSDDAWAGYVFDFLELYTPDVVSVDCYPIFHDFANMEYFRNRIKDVGTAAHAKKAKFYVMVQGFSQLGTWSYPTTFYWQKMLEAARDARADGIIFFLWTSGADGRNFVVGIDSMPQEYHRLLRAAVQTTPSWKSKSQQTTRKRNTYNSNSNKQKPQVKKPAQKPSPTTQSKKPQKPKAPPKKVSK